VTSCANYCYEFIFTVFFLHSISRCIFIIIITYSIMPKCNCTQCSHRSVTKCGSNREDKCRCNRKRSPKRSPKRKPTVCECNKCKPTICECNKCKPTVKPTCKYEDYANNYNNDRNDSDNEPDCNTQSHQFIITVKTTN